MMLPGVCPRMRRILLNYMERQDDTTPSPTRVTAMGLDDVPADVVLSVHADDAQDHGLLTGCSLAARALVEYLHPKTNDHRPEHHGCLPPKAACSSQYTAHVLSWGYIRDYTLLHVEGPLGRIILTVAYVLPKAFS